jgi:inosine/xanthosine triphosphate pyrophosphatase family protein
MTSLTYVTGNPVKFWQATTICSVADISLEQARLDIDEIQATTSEPIARHKAAQAFERLGKPVVVSDDSWIIPGLKGFPGPYMKYINDWFTSEDWLHLTRPLADRRTILQQLIVYQDTDVQKVFMVELAVTLLNEARGKSPYPHSTIISYDGGATSSAEHHEKGESGAVHMHTAWHEFTKWYTTEHA